MLKQTPSQASTAVALRQTAAAIRTGGWVRGTASQGTSMCLMYALYANTVKDTADDNGPISMLPMTHPYRQAVMAMGFENPQAAVHWNDYWASSAEEVIARLETAAAKMEEEALCC